MQKIVDYFRGNIRAQVTCPYAERFLNLCAKNGVWFRDMERVDECTVRATFSNADYKKLKKVLPRDFTVKPVRKWGTPFLMYGIRKRYALLIGTAVCFFAVWISSMFVFQINVTGNSTVPSSKILHELEELGVEIGTCSFTISQDYVSNEMLQRIPELCFLAVNVHGSRATVVVREAVEPPELLEQETPTLVYAKKGGIISKITAFEGETVCAKGETVVEGDTLVTGIVPMKLSGVRLVHAMAKVYAKTWHELSAQMPLERVQKVYTGAEKTKTTLIVGGKRINLFINSGIQWPSYDKITSYEDVSLFGGAVLPVTIVEDTYIEYTESAELLDKTAAQELLQSHLISELDEKLEDGEIVSTDFTVVEKDGVLQVTLNAECLEQIAVMRDLTQEEIASAQGESSIEEDTPDNG